MPEAMRPFLSVRDLLGVVAGLHASCLRRLAGAAAATLDLRRRVLLSFLVAREREQLRAIERLRGGDEQVLACFVQSVPAAAFAEACAFDLELGGCEQMIDSYLHREQALEHCFGQLKDAVGPRAETVFADLFTMKRQNQARLREASLDF